jgi:hypothetical protein
MPDVLMARPIPDDSWLHEPRFDQLRSALEYASTKTNAIPALAKVSPEEAAHLFLVMLHGYTRTTGEPHDDPA